MQIHQLGSVAYFSSDDYYIYLKQSQNPQFGLGVFAKRYIPAQTYIQEMRGDMVAEKDSNNHPFYWESKMFLARTEAVLCTTTIRHIKDIINFDVPSYTPQQIANIDTLKQFPTVPGLAYNCYFRTQFDKVFVVSLHSIEKDQELFMDSSFLYWEWFYKLYKQHPQQFFQHWEMMEEDCKKAYGPLIIGNSETWKISNASGESVKCTKPIEKTEFLIQCKGNIVPCNFVGSSDDLCLRIDETNKLYVEGLSKQVLNQVQEQSENVNSKLIRIHDQFFVIANRKISPGEQIIVDFSSVAAQQMKADTENEN